MSSCTSTPATHLPVLASNSLDRAASIRSTLDEAAASINAHHALVLSAVIAAKDSRILRDVEGFSAIRDWLLSKFDFTIPTASSIAIIAKLSGKFRLLTEAAVSGTARVDQVAYAVRQLDQTPAMRLFARTPFREPVASPFDASVACATPEALVSEYCAHAPFKDLKRHLHELWASVAEATELFDELGEQSLQRLELTETGNGLWELNATLSGVTGRLMEKYLKTACPPPRQDETDTDGVLPPQANRHAEALHQLLSGYGSSNEAVTRHGHTATLDLVVDIETLRGEDTGRLPLLEGQPISVERARLLACEGKVIPSVYDYATGEAIELGRAARLPNVALRRKLELEQREGCAWDGCDRPVAWCEAHHIVHWANQGETNAENLILLCRFHHGRVHTPGWTVEKTGPGQALITHHDHELAGLAGKGGNDTREGCGCSDYRTDTDLEALNATDETNNVFPTGLYREEWSDLHRRELDGWAETAEHHRCIQAIKAARAKSQARFTTVKPTSLAPEPPTLARQSVTVRPVDNSDIPFLPGPSQWQLRRGTEGTPPPMPSKLESQARVRAPPHARDGKPPPARTFPSPPARTPPDSSPSAGLDPHPIQPRSAGRHHATAAIRPRHHSHLLSPPA